MIQIKGTSNRILEIDLSTRTWSVFTVENQDRRLYLGGKGLGLKLLYDRVPPGIDPLGETNILAIMTGILMGTGAPCSGRFEAISKSPLTNLFSASSCGGPFGMQLKTAGYDGLLIKGKSRMPCLVHFDHEKVQFLDAAHLWGLDTRTVQEQILSKKQAAIVIGPAGENRVRFSNIASGSRFFGRGGFGAVMGAKLLKGVVASGGTHKIIPVYPHAFKDLKTKANAYIKRNKISGILKESGTAGAYLNLMNQSNMLPVWNFRRGTHDQGVSLSGQMFSEKHSLSHDTCKPCSIMCGHKGKISGRITHVPEYESLALMGSNLMIFDRESLFELNDTCNRLGLDTISAGGTLAWVMEAAEKGFVNSNLRFGTSAGIVKALEDIAYRKGLGEEMAMGSRAMSKKYGGGEFAMQVKGLEISGYDPRGALGQGLSFAVANRGGCHLSAFVVGLERIVGLLDPYSLKSKPDYVKFFEDLTCGINSLKTCLFTLYAYTLEAFLAKHTPDQLLGKLMQTMPKVTIPLLDISLYSDFYSTVTGTEVSSADFLKAGERIHTLERYMNTREGISRKDDILPGRLLFETRPGDDDNHVVQLEGMLDKYYKLRGYDSDGVPKPSTLSRLKIRV